MRLVTIWMEKRNPIHQWHTCMAENGFGLKRFIRVVGVEQLKKRCTGYYHGSRQERHCTIRMRSITAREEVGGSGLLRIRVGDNRTLNIILNLMIRSAGSVICSVVVLMFVILPSTILHTQ